MAAYPDEDFPDLQKALELSLALCDSVSFDNNGNLKAPLVQTTSIVDVPTPPYPGLTSQVVEENLDKQCLPSVLGPPVPGQEEAIIAIMGPCGTGKTSFINLVVGEEVGKVGYGLDYGTGGMQTHSFSYCNTNFTLVDTPGFDDASRTDTQILRLINDWLAQSFQRGEKLSAILYFHRITDPRMAGSPLRNFAMFKKLCGDDFYPNIVLGMTFWGRCDATDPGLAERREHELETGFWGTMIGKGSEMVRIPETRWLARELVARLAKKGKKALQHQVEVVNEGRSFQESTANQTLNAEITRIREEHQKQLQEQRKMLDEAAAERRKKHEEQEKEQKRRYEAQLAEQRAGEERLGQERQKQEEIAARLREEKEQEKKRIDREEDSLVEDLVARNIDVPTGVRNRYRLRRQLKYLEDVNTAIKRVVAGCDDGSVKIKMYDMNNAYMTMCDNCARRVGVGKMHVCHKCGFSLKDMVFDAFQFALCADCNKAPNVYCDDKSHYSSYEAQGLSDTQHNCRRVVNPFSPGASISCDGCSGKLGVMFFHCCGCNGDQFDLCLDCVLAGKTCKNPEEHGLDWVLHFPKEIPEILSRPKSS